MATKGEFGNFQNFVFYPTTCNVYMPTYIAEFRYH